MSVEKIIFFDIDRTLYDPDTKSIPESTKKALRQLHDDPKVEIAIATGRAFYMLHNIDEIKEYINIYILINGQIIIKDGETIFRNPISNDLICEVVQVFDEHDMKYGFLGEHDETLNIVDEKGKEAFELVDMKLPRTDPNFYLDNEVFQMWAFCDRTMHDFFKSRFPQLNLVRWLGGGFDLLSKGMSKKEGIQKILEIEGIPLEQAYAFGDGDNDVEMLDFIPHSVAMGNASDEAKKHATYVTDDIKNDGVYKGLKMLGFIND
jgi:Cof subfamily protein (haloacid dehalogenase superfamily)